MRKNLPVFDHEYQYPSEQTLVSVTDLKGRVTYCNPAFIEVSGFGRSEMLGQPHNLIRHPDMPCEAFRDLWATIEAGLPWTGMVKNRRKNGDFYWVQANITPIRDGEQVTGYLSVRTCPTREQVQVAELLFADMRAQAEAGRLVHVLHHGQVLRRDWRGRLARLRRPDTAVQLAGVQAGAAALAVLPPVLGAPLWLTGLAVLVAVAGAGALGWRLTLGPLRALVRDAHFLAAGDLSHTLGTGAGGAIGQLQQALFQLSVNLRTVVSDVRDEVHQLERSIQEIAQGNQNLSTRTETQASQLAQTAAAMAQISQTVQDSAHSATEGARVASQATGLVETGEQAVQTVSQAMVGINEAAAEIQSVVHLIEGVAFQTNLLALNAAVESARAGEAGRGFAVVAAEVRQLALRTTEAARHIRQLIDQSSARAASGSQATEQAREHMGESLQTVQQVDTLLGEISQAVREQQTDMLQIDAALGQLDNLTQQNVALVEEVTAAAQDLRNQAAGLSSTVQILRLRRGEPSLAQIDAVALRRQFKGQVLEQVPECLSAPEASPPQRLRA